MAVIEFYIKYPCNEYPLTSHFYIYLSILRFTDHHLRCDKIRVYRSIHYFLIFALKQENITIFRLKIIIFIAVKYISRPTVSHFSYAQLFQGPHF